MKGELMETSVYIEKIPKYHLQFYGYENEFRCRKNDCYYNFNSSCILYEEQKEERKNLFCYYDKPSQIYKKKNYLNYTIDLDNEGNVIKFNCHSYLYGQWK
jgi:hypothetical protein